MNKETTDKIDALSRAIEEGRRALEAQQPGVGRGRKGTPDRSGLRNRLERKLTDLLIELVELTEVRFLVAV